jgi:hypothetical protein
MPDGTFMVLAVTLTVLLPPGTTVPAAVEKTNSLGDSTVSKNVDMISAMTASLT